MYELSTFFSPIKMLLGVLLARRVADIGGRSVPLVTEAPIFSIQYERVVLPVNHLSLLQYFI